MEVLIKLNNQTAGRDKIARVLQYMSRLLWYRLKSGGRVIGVTQLKNIEFQLSTFRKLLRFGRSFDTLYAALPLFHHADSKVKHILILSKVCNALFLLADHLLWLGRADVCTVNTDRWSSLSNKYWLYAITLNLIRDLFEISRILKEQSVVPKQGVRSVGDVGFVGAAAAFSILQHPNVLVDTVKNACDFFIPLTALGHTNFTPGTIGILGCISSIAGLCALIDPKLKMTPS